MRTLSKSIEDIELVAEYFGFDIEQKEQFRAAQTIEYDMSEKVNKLLLKY